jgi:hypothetical protein
MKNNTHIGVIWLWLLRLLLIRTYLFGYLTLMEIGKARYLKNYGTTGSQ